MKENTIENALETIAKHGLTNDPDVADMLANALIDHASQFINKNRCEMKANEFIEKWNVAYTDREEQIQFAAEMQRDLESYASQFRQEWVSVEERLPEIKYHIDYRCSDNVLAWCEGYLRVMAYCVVDGERVWCDCGFDLQGDPLHNDDYIVTHWQPLPDPPSQP